MRLLTPLGIAHVDMRRLGLIVATGLSVGVYAVVVGSVSDSKVALMLLVTPVSLGLLLVKDSARFLLVLLVLSLSFSARFRLPPGAQFHPGGGELAIAPLDFPLLGLTVLWAARARSPQWRIPLRLAPVDIAFILFLIGNLLSLIPAADRGLAMLEILRLIKMGVLMLVIRYYIRTRRQVKFVVVLLLVAVIVQGALAVAQSLLGMSFGLGFLGEREEFWRVSREGVTFGRAGATMGHPNVLANFFEVLTPIALAVLLSRTRGLLRQVATIALGMGLVGVFLTFSRAGWAAMLIAAMVTLALMVHKRNIRARQFAAPVLLIVLLLSLSAIVLKDVIVNRVSLFWGASWIVRQLTAQTALDMFRSHSLLGIGANNYLSISMEYVRPELTPGWAEISAAIVHNIILLIASETGIIGLATFLLLLGAFIVQAHRIARSGDATLSPLAVGVMAGIIGLLTHGMWDWLLRYDPVYTLFWFQVGLLTAMRAILRREVRC